MPKIEIDFDVFKALTALREDESVTESEVIRRLLAKPDTYQSGLKIRIPGKKYWVSKGVDFPAGTELRARYKGELHSAVIVPLGVKVGGQIRSNLSLAAKVITGTTVNGWNFWEVKFPGDPVWRLAASLRPRPDQ